MRESSREASALRSSLSPRLRGDERMKVASQRWPRRRLTASRLYFVVAHEVLGRIWAPQEEGVLARMIARPPIVVGGDVIHVGGVFVRSNGLSRPPRFFKMPPIYPDFSGIFLRRPPYASWASLSRG